MLLSKVDVQSIYFPNTTMIYISSIYGISVYIGEIKTRSTDLKCAHLRGALEQNEGVTP